MCHISAGLPPSRLPRGGAAALRRAVRLCPRRAGRPPSQLPRRGAATSRRVSRPLSPLPRGRVASRRRTGRPLSRPSRGGAVAPAPASAPQPIDAWGSACDTQPASIPAPAQQALLLTRSSRVSPQALLPGAAVAPLLPRHPCALLLPLLLLRGTLRPRDSLQGERVGSARPRLLPRRRQLCPRGDPPLKAAFRI